MNHSGKVSRATSLLIAAMVAVLTLAVVVPGLRAAVTVASAATFTYNLAAGASSAPFFPAADRPVLVMGIQDTVGTRGVGFVTLLRVAGSFLEWTGLESTAGSAITQGFSSTPGTHIVFLDFSHKVDIRVNSADSFVVHNANTAAQTGNVTLIW